MSTPHGPFSWNKPIIEDDPGPPLIHTVSGAVSGLWLRVSKNQKKILGRGLNYVYLIETSLIKPRATTTKHSLAPSYGRSECLQSSLGSDFN